MSNLFIEIKEWFHTSVGKAVVIVAGLIAVGLIVIFSQQITNLFNLIGSQANTGHTIIVNGNPQAQDEYGFFSTGYTALPDQANCFKIDAGKLMLNSTCPQAHIDSISPVSGPIGQPVIINGSGFTGNETIKFGDVVAQLTGWQPDQLAVIAPDQADLAKVIVTVIAPGGPTSAYDGFTYNHAPAVSLIQPNIGPSDTLVTITGLNFVTGATVKFGTLDATNVQFVSETQLQVTAPAGGEDKVHVIVKNPDGQASAPIPFDQYTYTPAP